MTRCPYCDIEVSESAIEAEDGCCPECGTMLSTRSQFIDDDDYDDDLDDMFDDLDEDDDYVDEDRLNDAAFYDDDDEFGDFDDEDLDDDDF